MRILKGYQYFSNYLVSNLFANYFSLNLNSHWRTTSVFLFINPDFLSEASILRKKKMLSEFEMGTQSLKGELNYVTVRYPKWPIWYHCTDIYTQLRLHTLHRHLMFIYTNKMFCLLLLS